MLYNTKGVPKNYLILINWQILYQIVLEYYFHNEIIFEKLLYTKIPDFSFNKRQTAAYVKCN